MIGLLLARRRARGRGDRAAPARDDAAPGVCGLPRALGRADGAARLAATSYGRGMSEYAWIPPESWVERAHATALARSLGAAGYHELLALSTAEPERFWDAAARDLGIPFETPYERVLDVSDGPPWARWFEGGRLNIAQACVERWAGDPAHAGVEALVCEDEEGRTRTLTYAELAREVARCAEGLEALGVRSGDAVALLMPMAPEVVIAYYAMAAIGALVVPIFSGFSASAVASRLQDSRAVALITVDAFMRRGRPVPVKATADDACALAPDVRSVVVVRHTGQPVAWQEGRDIWWHELVDGRPGTRRADAGRQRAPVHARLHVGHDRTAQGRGARARRLHRQDGERGALHGRPAARRPHPLDDGHGLDHGAVAAGQLPRPRPDGDALRRRARLPRRRPHLAPRRAPPADVPGRLAHARARAAAGGRRARRRRRSLGAAAVRLDRRALESRSLAVALRPRRRRQRGRS